MILHNLTCFSYVSMSVLLQVPHAFTMSTSVLFPFTSLEVISYNYRQVEHFKPNLLKMRLFSGCI